MSEDYLSFSEASDDQFDYFVCKVKKQQPQRLNHSKYQQSLDQINTPLIRISEASRDEGTGSQILTSSVRQDSKKESDPENAKMSFDKVSLIDVNLNQSLSTI